MELHTLPLPYPLTEAEAYALAQLCKRITFYDCQDLSSCESERDSMLRVTDKIRLALQQAGFGVR